VAAPNVSFPPIADTKQERVSPQSKLGIVHQTVYDGDITGIAGSPMTESGAKLPPNGA